MKYLIICTYFPPDSSIAAVRPYMFAKYLSKMGHDVTVLCSGECFYQPDDSYDMSALANVNIISYLGGKADAAKYNAGEYEKKDLFPALPDRIRPIAEKYAHEALILEPVRAARRIKQGKDHFEIQKKEIIKLKDQSEEFDFVFSTYSNLENIYAGRYAAGVFNAKWIMDFRDPLVRRNNRRNLVWNAFSRRMTSYILEEAHLCTVVSEGLKRDLLNLNPIANVITLYNGYDSEDNNDFSLKEDKEHLVFCYTGTLYEERAHGLEIFAKLLAEMINSNCFDRHRILFKYAGGHSEIVKGIFKKYGVLDVLTDYGYISREKAQMIQNSCDIFLVLSWNTKSSQGILTGKFYEGIRARRPILSIVTGTSAYSELWKLNVKYNYGYCFESCFGKQSLEDLRDYLCRVYKQKFNEGITYQPKEEIFYDFHYEHLTKKLEQLCQELIEAK